MIRKDQRTACLELVDVYQVKEAARLLYEHLSLRPKNVNISHRDLPTYRRHLGFVRSKPYKAWYLIREADGFIGSIYLTKRDEVGIFILKEHQGKGRGREALTLLLRRHANVKRFLANISPKNPRSMSFFASLGFKHIQNTCELTRQA